MKARHADSLYGLKTDQELPREVRGLVGKQPDRLKLDHAMLYLDDTLEDLDDVLTLTGPTTKFVKMGSSGAEERVHEWHDFADTCNRYSVQPYIGGGLMEDAMMERGGITKLMSRFHRAGISTVEVSNSPGDRRACHHEREIRRIREDCETLLVEIGAKNDSMKKTVEWLDDLESALDLGADYIVLEASGSGNCGIYNRRSFARQGLLEAILQRKPYAFPKLILEAPHVNQREYWMEEMFGWSTMLGNIPVCQLIENADMRFEYMNMNAIISTLNNRLIHQETHSIVNEVAAEIDIPADKMIFSGSRLDGLHADSLREIPDWQEKLRHDLRALFTNQAESKVLIIPKRRAITYILR